MWLILGDRIAGYKSFLFHNFADTSARYDKILLFQFDLDLYDENLKKIDLDKELQHLEEGEILKIYRLRWQVELVFKRLKSILGIGSMQNKRADHIHTWLTGKIMVALLLEKELGELDCFPRGSRQRAKTQPIPRSSLYLSLFM